MTLRGTNQEFGRPYNRRIVLESIRLHGPIARGDIAKRVGLTVQTVSTIVRELEEHGYSCRCAKSRRAAACRLRCCGSIPEGGFAVGIHVTPLGIDAALINLSGDVVGSLATRSPTQRPTSLRSIGAMVPELTDAAAGRPHSRRRHGAARPFRRRDSMSFVGPTTMTGWKDVALPGTAGGLDRACPRFLRPTWRPRRSASSCMASGTRFSRLLLSLFRCRSWRRHGA